MEREPLWKREEKKLNSGRKKKKEKWFVSVLDGKLHFS